MRGRSRQPAAQLFGVRSLFDVSAPAPGKRRGGDTWDTNCSGMLEENEFGVFNVFDANDDQRVLDNEWNTASGGWDWGI